MIKGFEQNQDSSVKVFFRHKTDIQYNIQVFQLLSWKQKEAS